MKRVFITLCLLLTLLCAGCSATVFNFGTGSLYPMGGTLVNTQLFEGDASFRSTAAAVYTRSYVVVDFLPSLAVDGITLPITLSVQMVRDFLQHQSISED